MKSAISSSSPMSASSSSSPCSSSSAMSSSGAPVIHGRHRKQALGYWSMYE